MTTQIQITSEIKSGQRYVHRITKSAMHIKAVEKDQVLTTRGWKDASDILADYELSEKKKTFKTSLDTTREKVRFALETYGSIAACFDAGLKAGGYQ
jgi:hypothetical protein